MSAQEQSATVLFADISGSTALFDQLGNEVALQLVTLTLDMLRQEVTAAHGTVIKTIGDEIMCLFPTPAAAVEAACAMQTALEQQRAGNEHPIFVRIGLHHGSVLVEGEDVYGDTVNTAAHVTAITRARQIMTTQTVVDMLPSKLRKRTRPVLRTGFRGKQETVDVCQILWEGDDTMSTRIGKSAFRKPTQARYELMLRYHQQVITVSERMKCIVLGRSSDCDLVIRSNLASREHAHIEYNFGKFLLTDHSANGTYLRFADNQIIELNHQQIVLHGGGAICLGQSFSEQPTEVIEFILQ